MSKTPIKIERKDDEFKNKQEISGNVSVIPTEFNILPVRSNDEH